MTWSNTSTKCRTAHPRSRGEHDVEEIHSGDYGGSSPLARGTFPSARCAIPHSRLIPARAGNIRLIFLTRWRLAAHPRSRGEHSTPSREIWQWVGSSPLARGTFRNHSTPKPSRRLIPARAGNMTSKNCNPRQMPAHPRSRGEHRSSLPRATRYPGSSPLARGTYTGAATRRSPLRLIPARAGNIGRRRGE